MALDFGKAPMRDPRTGDIYISMYGDLGIVEGQQLFMQECRVALETIRGEDMLDQMYGFPVEQVIKNPLRLDVPTLLKTAILETLDPNRIPTLYEAIVEDVAYKGDSEVEEDIGVWAARVRLKSINGMTSTINIGSDAPFLSTV